MRDNEQKSFGGGGKEQTPLYCSRGGGRLCCRDYQIGQSGSDSTSRKELQTNGREKTRVLGKPRKSKEPYVVRRDCYR